MAETPASRLAARLLGVRREDLEAALTSRDVVAGREVVRRALDAEASRRACGALMKAAYGALFDFLVERVNGSIAGRGAEGGGDGDMDGAGASIGILDIFGFEIFEHNNFEQLCINYTNEAVRCVLADSRNPCFPRCAASFS